MFARAAALVLVLASCASAGASDSGPGPGVDGPTIDARVPIDAAPIDAPSNTCASAATCQTAIMLGSVSGDTANLKLPTTGTQSAWFRVRVTEDDNNIPGLTLRAAAKLTSPAAVDFDVFVYVNAGADVVECTTTVGTTTTTGNVNETKAEWGEGVIPNGSNDGRTISIEVRPSSPGGCAPGQMWQLEVEGNWN